MAFNMLVSFDTCDTFCHASKEMCSGEAKGVLFVMCPGNFVECPIGTVVEWMVLKKLILSLSHSLPSSGLCCCLVNFLFYPV